MPASKPGLLWCRRSATSRSRSSWEEAESNATFIGSLAGVSSICIDPKRGRRYHSLLEPFSLLGDKTPAKFIYRFATVVVQGAEDRLGLAYANWQALFADLRDPTRCPGLPEQLRVRFLGGGLYACGVLQCYRDDEAVLRAADQLENYAIKYYRMCADQLRAMYYANQGNLTLADHYRRRAELHAIQRGSAWQIEIWVPAGSIAVYLRTDDALGMKHAHAQLKQQAQRTPSLELLADRAKGAYLRLRRRYADALPFLESCLEEPPLAVLGWARAHGALARALNGMSNFARAKEVCERALSLLTPEDLSFSGMNLGLQIEYALAKAGLGDHEEAASDVERLLEQHRAVNSPLSMGALHEARARIALGVGDETTCLEHQMLMSGRFGGTGVPSLIARCGAFERQVQRRFSTSGPWQSDGAGDWGGASSSAISLLGPHGATGFTALEQALEEVTSLEECAERALRWLVDGVARAWAGIWLLNREEASLAARVGGDPPPEVAAWVAERVADIMLDDVTQTETADLATNADPSVLTVGGRVYRLSLVPGKGPSGDWVAVLVTGRPFQALPNPTLHLLEVLGSRLLRAQNQDVHP